MPQKKYSIQWENGEAVAFEVDGVVYTDLDQIPDRRDQLKIMAMMAASDQADFEDDESSADLSKPSFPMEKVVVWAFSGVAGLMLLIALISGGSAVKTILKEKSAPGTVTDVIAQREYINEQDHIIQEIYYPVVDFTADDGHRRTVQMSVGSNRPEYEKGNEVTVRYDPQHPLDARIQDFGSAALMWILPGITGILGLVFLTAVLAVRHFMPEVFRRQPDPVNP